MIYYLVEYAYGKSSLFIFTNNHPKLYVWSVILRVIIVKTNTDEPLCNRQVSKKELEKYMIYYLFYSPERDFYFIRRFIHNFYYNNYDFLGTIRLTGLCKEAIFYPLSDILRCI